MYSIDLQLFFHAEEYTPNHLSSNIFTVFLCVM